MKQKKSISPDKLKALINFWAEKNWRKCAYRDDVRNPQSDLSFEEKTEYRHSLSEFVINHLFEKADAAGEAEQKEVRIVLAEVVLERGSSRYDI